MVGYTRFRTLSLKITPNKRHPLNKRMTMSALSVDYYGCKKQNVFELLSQRKNNVHLPPFDITITLQSIIIASTFKCRKVSMELKWIKNRETTTKVLTPFSTLKWTCESVETIELPEATTNVLQ
jgi:hypothetical protein